MSANQLSTISSEAQTTADLIFIQWCRVEDLAKQLLEIDATDERNVEKLQSVTALSEHLSSTLASVHKLTQQCTEIIEGMIVWRFPA